MTTETAPVTLVRNVRIFDGTRVLPASCVLVEQGLIADVRPRISPPAGSLVINGRGRTLLPGFIDCHTHVSRRMLQQAVVLGVTTELDMFADPSTAAALSAQAERHEDMADLSLLRSPAARPGTRWLPPVAGGREAVGAVRMLPMDHAPGGGGYGVGGGLVRLVVTAGNARRRLMIAHVTSRESAWQAVADGVDGLTHLFVDAAADESLVAAVRDSGAFVIPTLTALEALCGTPSGAGLAGDPRFVPYLDDEARCGLVQALPPLGEQPYRIGHALDAVGRLHAAGVPLLAGTDAPSPGTAHGASLHRELELMVSAGLSAVEALAAATSVPARCFGLTDRGRIARGLHADLVLVDGDPTSDITATRAIVGVWRRGMRVDREAFLGRSAGRAPVRSDSVPLR